METKVINGFKSWWVKFAQDRTITFCSKWCSGWTLQLRNHYVIEDQKLEGGRGSLSVCITPPMLHLSVSFWSHLGYRVRWIFAFPCNDSMAVLLLCFSVIEIHDWSIYLFLFVCFSTSSVTLSCGWPKHIGEFVPHRPSKWQRITESCGWKRTLRSLSAAVETAQSPFTRGSYPHPEKSSGLGRALWDWQPSFSSSYSLKYWWPWRNGHAAPSRASPSPASSPRADRLWAASSPYD